MWVEMGKSLEHGYSEGFFKIYWLKEWLAEFKFPNINYPVWPRRVAITLSSIFPSVSGPHRARVGLPLGLHIDLGPINEDFWPAVWPLSLVMGPFYSTSCLPPQSWPAGFTAGTAAWMLLDLFKLLTQTISRQWIMLPQDIEWCYLQNQMMASQDTAWYCFKTLDGGDARLWVMCFLEPNEDVWRHWLVMSQNIDWCWLKTLNDADSRYWMRDLKRVNDTGSMSQESITLSLKEKDIICYFHLFYIAELCEITGLASLPLTREVL